MQFRPTYCRSVCYLSVLLSVSAAFAEVPFNALRVGCAFTDEGHWPGLRAALEAHRAAFDEVWLSTGVAFPPLAWHTNQARRCAAAAEDLRRLGIVPSVEIQTIVGHSDVILLAGDCSGQDWATWTGSDGTAAKRVSCPRDPRLADYFERVAELHAAWKPGSLWVDDDVTLRSRVTCADGSKGLFGCFCDRCIADFAARDGRDWSRPGLAAAVCGDAAVSNRWEAFHVDGMHDLCRRIAAAVHRVSPQTVFGYQFGYSGRVGIAKGLHDGSGRPVRLRPGAFAYWDFSAHDQIHKAYELADLLVAYGTPDWIEARCPEIESCPRAFSCRTPQGFILEAFENLALGMDFLSMYVVDARYGEDIRFYRERLFPRLASAHGFLKGFRDRCVGSLPCGFTVSAGIPAPLVACRGVPIVAGRCRSLGELPDLATLLPHNRFMDSCQDFAARQRVTMQTASGPALLELYRWCERASGGRLPVRFEEPVMAFAVPRVRADGTLVALAVVNASIDRQEPVTVRLRGVPAKAEKAVWRSPEREPVELVLVRTGGEATVRLPQLGAWTCGYLAFD